VLTTVTLSVIVACLTVALTVSEMRRRRTQRQVLHLERRVREIRNHGGASRSSRTMRAVVGGALDTASKVRDVGVTSAMRSSLEGLLRWSIEGQSNLDALAGPDGTVTIVFSDIQDSTVHNDQLGDTLWMRVLESHDRLVQSTIAGYGGRIVKSQGDGFMMAFADPTDAVRGGLAVQSAIETGDRRLRRTPIQVRVGIHVGKAKERAGDLFGRDVALAARVADHASGGEVLVSEEVREAVVDATDITFTDPRDVELKGLTGEYRLWRAESALAGEVE
jgi:class 3 adenylate cyclase